MRNSTVLSPQSNANTVETTVLAVLPQVGAAGLISPLVEVEPVVLDGILIHAIRCDYYSLIPECRLGAGARLLLGLDGKRAIIRDILCGSTEICLPEVCPSCGKPLHWFGHSLRCSDPAACPDTVKYHQPDAASFSLMGKEGCHA